MSTKIEELIDQARNITMTKEMAREQRQSFAFGNVNLHNPTATRELIAKVDDESSE